MKHLSRFQPHTLFVHIVTQLTDPVVRPVSIRFPRYIYITSRASMHTHIHTQNERERKRKKNIEKGENTHSKPIITPLFAKDNVFIA